MIVNKLMRNSKSLKIQECSDIKLSLGMAVFDV